MDKIECTEVVIDEIEQSSGINLTEEAKHLLLGCAATPERMHFAFRCFVAAGVLRIPQNLPPREESYAARTIFHMRIGEEDNGGALPAREKQSCSSLARLILHVRIAITAMGFHDGFVERFVDPPRVSDKVFAHRKMLAEALMLDRLLEQYRGKWRIDDEALRATFIAKEITTMRRHIDGAVGVADELQGVSLSGATKKSILTKGARTVASLERGQQLFHELREAAGLAAEMTETSRTQNLPHILQVTLPTRVTRKVVLDTTLHGEDAEAVRDFFIPLFDRQERLPAPVDFIVDSLRERDWKTLSYPQDGVHPLLAVHEIARRSGENDAALGNDTRKDLLKAVFDDRKPLLTAVRDIRTMRVSDKERLSPGPLYGKTVAEVPVITGFTEWLPDQA